jgi:hypothetical protein
MTTYAGIIFQQLKPKMEEFSDWVSGWYNGIDITTSDSLNKTATYWTDNLLGIKTAHASTGEEMFTNTNQNFGNIQSSIEKSGNGALDSVKSNFGGIEESVTSKSNAAKEQGSSFFDKLGTSIRTTGNNILTSVSNSFSGVKTSITGNMASSDMETNKSSNNILSSLTRIGAEAWNSVKNGLESFKQSFDKWLSGVRSWGTHFIDNFINGMEDKLGDLKEKGLDTVKKLLEKLKFSKNPLIPSEEWGKHFIQNFADGIISQLPLLSNTIANAQGVMSLNSPILSTGAITNTAGAVNGAMSRPQSANVVTNNAGNTININPGMMIASRGEVRKFARMISDVQQIETERFSFNEA